MTDSVRDHLAGEMECEGLLECFHGLTALDRDVFRVLSGADGRLTVDEVADAVDRERSTAYRSVRRLVDAGFVRSEQVNYDDAGYYHAYEPVAAEEVAADLHAILHERYAMMDSLIDDFERRYADERADPPASD